MTRVYRGHGIGRADEEFHAYVAAEVNWYRRNGRYLDRIIPDATGVLFVIGDWSWNRKYPERREYVDGQMANACRQESLDFERAIA